MSVCLILALVMEKCQQSRQWWVSKARKGAIPLETCVLHVVPMIDWRLLGTVEFFPYKITASQVACRGSHELRRRGKYSSHRILYFPR